MDGGGRNRRQSCARDLADRRRWVSAPRIGSGTALPPGPTDRCGQHGGRLCRPRSRPRPTGRLEDHQPQPHVGRHDGGPISARGPNHRRTTPSQRRRGIRRCPDRRRLGHGDDLQTRVRADAIVGQRLSNSHVLPRGTHTAAWWSRATTSRRSRAQGTTRCDGRRSAVVSTDLAPVPFDFCLSNLALLTD